MSSWTCEQLESRLNGYLEGKMAGLEFQAADLHARSCPHCREWFEARQARALLLQLEEMESPPGLETRILAQTLAPPERETLADTLAKFWQVVWQPRVLYGLAAAVFSLTMIFTSLDVPLRELEPSDLNPVNIYRALDRKAQLAYARGVRFFNELRVVYEIRNQLAGTDTEPEEQQPRTPGQDGSGNSGEQNRREDQRRNFLQGRLIQQSLASGQFRVMRTLQ